MSTPEQQPQAQTPKLWQMVQAFQIPWFAAFEITAISATVIQETTHAILFGGVVQVQKRDGGIVPVSIEDGRLLPANRDFFGATRPDTLKK